MSDFSKILKEKSREIHRIARDKGFYDNPRSPLEHHMLIVSEIAEATEEVRKGTKPVYRVGAKYEGEAIEMADALIRILDYCHWQGFNLGEAVELKLEYNKSRPYMHGKKL